MNLQILIPTYNRAKDLNTNLCYIVEIINRHKLYNEVGILISDNCSTDETQNICVKLSDLHRDSIKIEYYRQEENVGLQRNALFCLRKSSAKKIMFLGDDDYVVDEYIIEVLNLIKSDNLSCIVPSYIEVLPNGIPLSTGRDLNLSSKRFKSGLEASLYFSWRAHQLSGIVLNREGILENFEKHSVNNIYPFTYFVTFATQKGDSYHLTDWPIKVTQPGQEKKDWGYGSDGLLDEIFNNYKCIFKAKPLIRFLHETQVIRKQPWRVVNSLIKSPLAFMRSIYSSKNTSLLMKVTYPIFISYFCIRLVKIKFLNK